MNTILLTGIPRSGTTLLCKLLNDLPDVVALSEPMQPPQSVDAATAEIEAFVRNTRRSILTDRKAPAVAIDGAMADNYFDAPKSSPGLRTHRGRPSLVPIDKRLSQDFTLYVKHTAFFTALSRQRSIGFPLYALVRHPLAALASWQTVDIPLNRGRIPAAEALDSHLRNTLDKTDNCLARQVIILSWFLETYGAYPRDHILRYEDLVADPATTIRRLHPGAEVGHAVWDEPMNERYEGIDFRPLANAIMPLAPLAARFYPDFEDSLKRYR